ncbi:hypothetical protein E4U41_000129 [Claviceps citrina]|nr:hypothetical protein E4U41_000129 [Claviceps citrina]
MGTNISVHGRHNGARRHPGCNSKVFNKVFIAPSYGPIGAARDLPVLLWESGTGPDFDTVLRNGVICAKWRRHGSWLDEEKQSKDASIGGWV